MGRVAPFPPGIRHLRKMTIMVTMTIVTYALLASAFVNPAFVSSSSQHLSNDHYADFEEGAYDYVYPDTDLLLQKRGGYCMSYGRGCSTKGIPCCDSHICRCNVFGGNCKCLRSGLFGRR